jgi:hypothetical protein
MTFEQLQELAEAAKAKAVLDATKAAERERLEAAKSPNQARVTGGRGKPATMSVVDAQRHALTSWERLKAALVKAHEAGKLDPVQVAQCIEASKAICATLRDGYFPINSSEKYYSKNFYTRNVLSYSQDKYEASQWRDAIGLLLDNKIIVPVRFGAFTVPDPKTIVPVDRKTLDCFR